MGFLCLNFYHPLDFLASFPTFACLVLGFFSISLWVLFLVTIITVKLWQMLHFLQEMFYFEDWWVSFIFDAWSISSWSLLLECSTLRVPSVCIKCLWGLFSIGRCLISLFLQPHETIKMPLSHYYKICKYPGR